MADLPALPAALNAIVNTFDKYASIEGDADMLSKAEMKTLIEKELVPLLKECKDLDKKDELFGMMDANEDGQVDFPEFMMTLAMLTIICSGKSCDLSKLMK